MADRVIVPEDVWKDFLTMQGECKNWDYSYHEMLMYCMRSKPKLAGWISHNLPPSMWKDGIERGFINSRQVRKERQPTEGN